MNLFPSQAPAPPFRRGPGSGWSGWLRTARNYGPFTKTNDNLCVSHALSRLPMV